MLPMCEESIEVYLPFIVNKSFLSKQELRVHENHM